MGMRVWRQYHGTGFIGLAQRFVARLIQVEISQTVVDHVHRGTLMPQLAVVPSECRWIGNGGGQTKAGKQLTEQLKLRRQVLRDRVVVDDQHRLQWRCATLQSPLGLEHVEQGLLQRIGLAFKWKRPIHGFAAGLLGPCQRDVEQGAPGIGVDLDQSRTLGAEVKVKTHAGADRAEGVLRNGRRARQGLRTVAGQGNNTLDGCHQLCDLLFHLARHKHHR